MAKPRKRKLRSIRDYVNDKGEMIEQMFASIPIVEVKNMVPINLQGMPLHELKAECLIELLSMSDSEITNILDGRKRWSRVALSESEESSLVLSETEDEVSFVKKKKKNEPRVGTKKNDDADALGSKVEETKKKRKKKKKVTTEEQLKKKKKLPDSKCVSVPSTSKGVSSTKMQVKPKEAKGSSLKEKSTNDEVVIILDDDEPEKGEKKAEKSLLDLLELEMRARAIKALLRTEDDKEKRKRLEEYKDEPDDLIPVVDEHPQIEILSDSDEEKEATSMLQFDGDSLSMQDAEVIDSLLGISVQKRIATVDLSEDASVLSVTDVLSRPESVALETEQPAEAGHTLEVEGGGQITPSKSGSDDENVRSDKVHPSLKDSTHRNSDFLAQGSSPGRDVTTETLCVVDVGTSQKNCFRSQIQNTSYGRKNDEFDEDVLDYEYEPMGDNVGSKYSENSLEMKDKVLRLIVPINYKSTTTENSKGTSASAIVTAREFPNSNELTEKSELSTDMSSSSGANCSLINSNSKECLNDISVSLESKNTIQFHTADDKFDEGGEPVFEHNIPVENNCRQVFATSHGVSDVAKDSFDRPQEKQEQELSPSSVATAEELLLSSPEDRVYSSSSHQFDSKPEGPETGESVLKANKQSALEFGSSISESLENGITLQTDTGSCNANSISPFLETSDELESSPLVIPISSIEQCMSPQQCPTHETDSKMATLTKPISNQKNCSEPSSAPKCPLSVIIAYDGMSLDSKTSEGQTTDTNQLQLSNLAFGAPVAETVESDCDHVEVYVRDDSQKLEHCDMAGARPHSPDGTVDLGVARSSNSIPGTQIPMSENEDDLRAATAILKSNVNPSDLDITDTTADNGLETPLTGVLHKTKACAMIDLGNSDRTKNDDEIAQVVITVHSDSSGSESCEEGEFNDNIVELVSSEDEQCLQSGIRPIGRSAGSSVFIDESETITIGDDEVVNSLVQQVPIEILELDDSNDEKSSWTARWLESDHVKKVVKTSKMLMNLRKKLMNQKKNKVQQPSQAEIVPRLIGSVDEYNQLVRDGIISTSSEEAVPSEKCASLSDDMVKSSDGAIISQINCEGSENQSSTKGTVKSVELSVPSPPPNAVLTNMSSLQDSGLEDISDVEEKEDGEITDSDEILQGEAEGTLLLNAGGVIEIPLPSEVSDPPPDKAVVEREEQPNVPVKRTIAKRQKRSRRDVKQIYKSIVTHSLGIRGSRGPTSPMKNQKGPVKSKKKNKNKKKNKGRKNRHPGLGSVSSVAPLPPTQPLTQAVLSSPSVNAIQVACSNVSNMYEGSVPQSIVSDSVQLPNPLEWTFSQGNYGYGNVSDTSGESNVYKQWEEYYRTLMEACRASAAHMSANKSYDWVFDPSKLSSTAQALTSTDESVAPSVVPSAAPSSVIPSNSTDQSHFQYRFGLKGPLRERFVSPNILGNETASTSDNKF